MIDEDQISLDVATTLFQNEYFIHCFSSWKSAKVFLMTLDEKIKPDLFCLDIEILEKHSKEILDFLQTSRFLKVPFVFLSKNYDTKVQEWGLELGASDFILKPYSPRVAKLRISKAIDNSLERQWMESELLEQHLILSKKEEKLVQNTAQIVDVLLSTLGTNHIYTEGHSFRVSEVAVALAKKISYPEDKLLLLKQGGLLHDMGKLGVNSCILNKPTGLSNEEYQEAQLHTVLGYTILLNLKDFVIERDIACHHHERWDGTGYPDHLKGEEISLESRIVAIADVFDVLKRGRVYQDAIESEKIALEFEANAGSQFDPALAKIFANMVRNGELEELLQIEEPEQDELCR